MSRAGWKRDTNRWEVTWSEMFNFWPKGENKKDRTLGGVEKVCERVKETPWLQPVESRMLTRRRMEIPLRKEGVLLPRGSRPETPRGAPPWRCGPCKYL